MCDREKKEPAQRRIAPEVGEKPPERGVEEAAAAAEGSQGAQIMFSGGTAQPESFRCFMRKSTEGPASANASQRRVD